VEQADAAKPESSPNAAVAFAFGPVKKSRRLIGRMSFGFSLFSIDLSFSMVVSSFVSPF
jgi:hypothetical protein